MEYEEKLKKDAENIELISKKVEVQKCGMGIFSFETEKDGIMIYNQEENTMIFVNSGKKIQKAWKFIRKNILD